MMSQSAILEFEGCNLAYFKHVLLMHSFTNDRRAVYLVSVDTSKSVQYTGEKESHSGLMVVLW